MSNSVKKAIFKEGNGKARRGLRKRIRRVQRHFLKENIESLIEGNKVLPNDKSIVNDYDYSDYKIDYEHRTDSWWTKNSTDEEFNEAKKKFSRK